MSGVVKLNCKTCERKLGFCTIYVTATICLERLRKTTNNFKARWQKSPGLDLKPGPPERATEMRTVCLRRVILFFYVFDANCIIIIIMMMINADVRKSRNVFILTHFYEWCKTKHNFHEEAKGISAWENRPTTSNKIVCYFKIRTKLQSSKITFLLLKLNTYFKSHFVCSYSRDTPCTHQVCATAYLLSLNLSVARRL